MKIRRLKLSGFKSFVESSELRVEPGLTGVVGPNGCGKSNLLEALRWAMGEASPKSLRGGGMDDVIFAGTATRPPRDFAEVTILLDRDGLTGDGASESEITRRIERGAGSAYRIDGRDVRAKDVALLFADAATGAHSPALVSQGRIGAVIAAKPVERRQMLEEAAGIAGLHARRKDAEQKLRATEANLASLAELLSDQDARAGALRRQARAAERYRRLTTTIRQVEARLIHARWVEADRTAEAAAAEARSAADQVDSLQRTIASHRDAQDRAAADLTERRCALADARDAGVQLAHQLATARARRDTVARRLTELDRLDRALADDIARERALQGDAAKAIAQLGSEREAIDLRLADAEAQAARIAGELGEAETESREAEAALAEILARQAAMRAERRVADAALEAAKAQAARTGQERSRLADQSAALGDGSIHRSAALQASSQLDTASAALSAAEASMAQAEQQRSAAAERRDAAETALATARAVLAASTSEHQTLVRALEQGRPGVVANLAADRGFERALAAALGDDADAAVGGDGPRRWAGSEPRADDPALPTGLQSIVHYVTAPPELRRRLRQVAVADEDDGTELAVGQRLVTRDGHLRRWDGFEAAGSGAAAAERLIRVNRLAELAAALPGEEQAVRDADAERDAAVAAVEEYRAAGETARTAAAKAERDAREATRAGDSAGAALERIESQRVLLTERVADLARVAAAAADALAAAEAARAALPDPAALEREVGAARDSAATRAAAVADKRADAATKARETAADRERHAAAGREAGEWRRRMTDAEARLAAVEARAAEQADERRLIELEPARLDLEIGRLEQDSAGRAAALASLAGAEEEAEHILAAASAHMATASEQSSEARERRAAATARAEAQTARSAELARSCVERFDCLPQRLPEKMAFDADELRDPSAEAASLERLTAERERMGPVNLVAEQELAELDAARLSGAAEAEELTQAIHRLRGSIGSLNREGRVRLLDAYTKVDAHFRRLFTTLFDGGQAHLELVESDDPLEAGLEIMAQPPGKRLSTLTLLSGGEQALTAIALIFALFLTNPAPICVLDEVDAPLDDANVERFCDLLDRMTQETDTRYLIVTHNAVTMSRMHRLYGVTMIEQGVSRLVSVDLSAATQMAAE